jgi:hypothetical protein
MRIDATKAKKLTDKARQKIPFEKTKPIIFLAKVHDKISNEIRLLNIYRKVRWAAHNKDNYIFVREISPVLKEKLEKEDKFLVTYHRYAEGFYIRW